MKTNLTELINDTNFRDAIEFLKETLGDRSWHKNETRRDYRKKYLELERLVSDLEAEFQSQLPTIEDIQKIYREYK